MRSLPRILQAALLAISLVGFGVVAQAQIAPYQASSNLQAAGTANSCVVSTGATGSCVVAHCPSGQSGAVVYVPAGTSITGTVSVYTAADVNGSPGTYGTPYHSYAAQSATDSNTMSSFPGRLYVQLGGDGWVEAVFTTATSGHATATITCSAAVAVQHVGLPLSVANGGNGTASPNPTVTAGACSSSPSISGWPSFLLTVPAGCSSGGGTALSFSSTATGTNYNPQVQTASSYFASTTTITPPSAPYVLRLRALVTATSSSNGYYGILVSSDGVHFEDWVVQVVGTGYVSADGDCTVSACATGGYANPFPIAAHQPVYIDAYVAVYSSTLVTIGGVFSGSPVCAGGVFGGATGKCAFTSTAVNFTNPLTVYAVGGASTDVVAAAYSASLF